MTRRTLSAIAAFMVVFGGGWPNITIWIAASIWMFASLFAVKYDRRPI